MCWYRRVERVGSTGEGWSIYGAKRAQPLATGGKCDGLDNGSNKPIRNRWQATATVSQRMVKRLFATGCRIPRLVREGVDLLALQREVESREREPDSSQLDPNTPTSS